MDRDNNCNFRNVNLDNSKEDKGNVVTQDIRQIMLILNQLSGSQDDNFNMLINLLLINKTL